MDITVHYFASLHYIAIFKFQYKAHMYIDQVCIFPVAFNYPISFAVDLRGRASDRQEGVSKKVETMREGRSSHLKDKHILMGSVPSK
jgi:hypothetical protein